MKHNQSMLRRSVIQMLQDQGVSDKHRFLPFVNERDGIGRLLSSSKLVPVSYTHLTLPTNREV